MAKKKWLFHIFKKLFLCEAESLQAKKNKRWGWISGNCKKVKQLGELRSESKLEDAREEQMKHAMNVARATAVAAEAAVAAAQAAAAAVVRLTGMPNTHKEMKDWAATRIQTAFRAYLARKALRALKGLVRLQAIVRGQAVRRHLGNELKRSPSSTKLICLGRNPSSDSDAGIENGCKFRPIVRRRKELGEAVRAEKLWNNEMYSNEELNSPSLRRQKDCMRQYSYSHRERHMQFAQILEEPLSSGSYSDRHGFWVRQPWASGKPERREEHGNLATTSRSKLQRRVLRREHCMEEELYSPLSNPRRSLCQLRERSSGELSPSACSSIYPSYMGSTESAKAKMRSMSTPRHRIRYLDNYHSNCHECGGTSYKNTWAAALNCQAMTQDSNCSHHLRSLSMRSLKH